MDEQTVSSAACGITTTRLSKTFPGASAPAVDDVSLEVESGTFVSLLGSSGCGKTTTLRMIAGLETPSSGDIAIGDTLVFSSRKKINVPPHQRPISMVFQSYALWPHMSVFSNVAYPLRRARLPKQEIRERVLATLKLLRCESLAERYPSEISGGQQQRVALGRAIVSPRSQVILFDEPLSNLDAKLREELRYDLRALQEELNFTAIYVTHDQAEAMSMSDDVVMMRDGRIERSGNPESVFRNPGTRFVAEFFGAQNVVAGRVEKVDVDEVVAETAVGRVVVGRADDLGVEVGQRVSVAFPTSSLRVASVAQGRTPAEASLGIVDGASYFGDYSDLRLIVGTEKIRCRHSGLKRFARGEAVAVTLAGSASIVQSDGLRANEADAL